MKVCVRKPRQRAHSRYKRIFRFRRRKTARRPWRPWRPRRAQCRRRSVEEDELERELESAIGSSDFSYDGSLVSEQEYRFDELREAVDPAAHSSFDPPLAAVDKVQGCPRCRLIAAVLGWHRAHDELGFKGNSPVYILHRNKEDLQLGFLDGCWWCVRISESLAKWKREKPKRGTSGWPITFQLLGSTRAIYIEAGDIYWWEQFTFWELPSSDRLPRHRGEEEARPGPVTSPGNVGPTSFWFGNMRLELAQAVSPSISPIFNTTGLRLEGAKRLERNTDNPTTWAYVKGRLENCARNHPACRGSEDWVPSRLVEVATLESMVRLRLVSTSEWEKAKPYTTLSHRWGSNTTFRLTKRTCGELQQGIPVEELSQKYIDAARATIELGVGYIWIDSLCIIQDDPEDWRRESAQMHLVYRHGFCNLSAASSVSPYDGLFFNRDPNRVKPYVLDHDGGTERIMITQDGYDNSWFQKLDQEPLYSRAWVCQERLLATRNVSFTEHLVFFECAEELSCEVCDSSFRIREGGGFRLGREMSASQKPLSLRTIGTHRDATRTAATREEDHATWRNIMMFYSRCGITFLADKLLAIAGVARVFHATFASEYAAGLWKDDILRDLAWMRWHEPDREGGEAVYVAPSWSWASLGSARVFYEERRGTHQPLAACEDVQTTPLGRDPFGQLASGFLRLRGYAIPLRRAPDHGRRPEGSGNDAEKESRLLRDLEPELLYSLGCPSSDLRHRLDTYVRATTTTTPTTGAAAAAQYYAVPLYAVDDARTVEFCTTFLLLAPLTPARGRYRRVGLAEVSRPARGKTRRRDAPSPEGGEEDSTAIPRKWRSLGLVPRAYRFLQRMLEDAEKVDDVPAHDRGPDGRWLITIV